MSRISAKSKDEILTRLNATVYLPEGQDNEEIVRILMADKLVMKVSVLGQTQYHITDKGVKFIHEGGYLTQKRRRQKGYFCTLAKLLVAIISVWLSLIKCGHAEGE